MVILRSVKTDILDTLADSMVLILRGLTMRVHWWRSIPVCESQGPNRDGIHGFTA